MNVTVHSVLFDHEGSRILFAANSTVGGVGNNISALVWEPLIGLVLEWVMWPVVFFCFGFCSVFDLSVL